MAGLGEGLSSFASSFKSGMDIAGDIYDRRRRAAKDEREAKSQDIVDALRQAQVDELMTNILEKKRAKEIAGNIPTTETTTTEVEEMFPEGATTRRETKETPVSPEKWLEGYGRSLLKENPALGVQVLSSATSMKNQALEASMKPITIVGKTVYELGQSGVDLEQSKPFLDTLFKQAGIPSGVDGMKYNDKTKLLEVTLKNGLTAIVDATGHHTIVPEKQATEWDTRVKAARGDTAASKALAGKRKEELEQLTKKGEIEIKVAKEKAKTDPMTMLLAREEAKRKGDERAAFRKRRDEYEDKKFTLSQQWAEDMKTDPAVANENWNSGLHDLYKTYADLWQGQQAEPGGQATSTNAGKKTFDIKIPENGIIDQKTLSDLQAMYEQEAGAKATMDGFKEFTKKYRIKGVMPR